LGSLLPFNIGTTPGCQTLERLAANAVSPNVLLDLAARLIAQDEAPGSIERGGRKAHPV
jgi:hypothetical protein